MPKTIVVVEDDADDQEFIRAALEEIDVSSIVLFHSNGQEALAYLRSTSEQTILILSDVNMPGINGLDLQEKINNEEALRNKNIPFVFFSTSIEPRHIERANKYRLGGYFEKPTNYQKFKHTIQAIVIYWEDNLRP